MSHSYYNKQWVEAQAAISDLLQQELPPEPPKPEKDRLAAFQLLATMYIKYVQIFRRLEQCYDQIVHPQKRRVLRHVLDGTIGRILELKNEMVFLEYSEFHYFDDVLSDLKLTPTDVEMPIPKYFVLERAKALQEQEKRLGEILAKLGPQEREGDKEEIQMTLEEAIRLIQIHERARQGRLRAKFMREIRQQQEKERLAADRGAPTLDPDLAAIRIQKLWKGFAQRKRTKQEREEEMMFIGMVPFPLASNPKHTPQYLSTKTHDDRHNRQLKHEHEYVQALNTIKHKIKETEGPDMKETMMDQIRQWFIECRDASGKFPEYPAEDEGGSALIFKEKDPAELEAELRAKEDGKDKGKKGKKEKGKKKDKKKDKKGKGKKGKGDDEEEDEGWKMAPSNFVPAINEATDTYGTVWQPRDEGDNFEQKHDSELIKEEKRVEVETEIRVQVDELMRAELKNLKLAVDRDKGKKGKKGKSGKKKKKKKSGKKGKKGKKEKDLTPDSVFVASSARTLSDKGAEDCIEMPNTLDDQETWMGRDSDKSRRSGSGRHHMPNMKGKKKEKDLTGNRTPGDLFEELVKEGIIIRYPKLHLNEYVGEYSYLGTTLRQANLEPMPSISDVRRLVTEYAILPLGSPAVHEKSPLIKSMLLSGPRGTGKKMLVHCVCTETGAVMFDLSAQNIADKYPGKDGIKMLMHMVFKVGRAYQPAVIFIGECEKMFKKKVPKTEIGDPKKLKKELPKALKTIKTDDRIMLIGTSRMPFDGEMKPMASTYQKLILIPRPDYASRHLLWRQLIVKSGGVVSLQLDISSLAKITDGYTPGQMLQASQQVLTERRINQLSKKPVQSVEFIAPLARMDPVYKEEEEAFKAWYAKTPLGKKRAKAAAGEDEEPAGKKGKKGGKKGKKKK